MRDHGHELCDGDVPLTDSDILTIHMGRLALSINDVRRLAGVDVRTAKRWLDGSKPLPASVHTLLCVMRKYGLSHDQVLDAREALS